MASELQAADRPLDLLDTAQAGTALIRGGALRGGAYLLGILLSVAAVPLMTRHLGVVDFGRFVTVTSLITLVAVLVDAGLANIGLREFSVRDGESRKELLRNLLGLRTVLSVLGALGATAFAAAIGYPGVLVAGALIAGCGLVVSDVQETFAIPLAGSLRLAWVSALQLLNQAVLVLLVVVLVLAGAGLLPFFAVSAVAGLVALGATVALTRGSAPKAPAFDQAEWRSLVRDMLPYAAATAISAIRLVVVLMPLLTVARQTGYFAVSFRVFEVLAGLGGVLIISAFPVLARAVRDDQERLRYALGRLFEVAAITGVGVVLLTVVGAKLAVDVVAGPLFHPSIPALRIIAFAVLASYMSNLWGLVLLSLRRYIALLVTNGIVLVVAIGLGVLLVPDHGAKGAAIAVLASECVHTVAYGAILRMSRPDLRVPLEILPRLALAAGIAGVAAWLLPVPAVAALVLAAIVYLGVLVAVRAVPGEVWATLRPG